MLPFLVFGVCSRFCCAVHCALSCFVIILIGKRELFVLLCLSSWCLVTVIDMWLFLMVLWLGLQCVIVVFSDCFFRSFVCNYRHYGK